VSALKIKAPALRRLNAQAICASKRAYTEAEACAAIVGHDCRKCRGIAPISAYRCPVKDADHWHTGHRP
jgi:hypothetical protein